MTKEQQLSEQMRAVDAFIRLAFNIPDRQDCRVGNHFVFILMNFDGPCAVGGFKTSLCQEHFCAVLEQVAQEERKNMAA